MCLTSKKVIFEGNKDFFILLTVIIGVPLTIILKVNFDSSMKAFKEKYYSTNEYGGTKDRYIFLLWGMELERDMRSVRDNS